MKRENQFEGCLLGGAIGDALGYPVEFLSFDELLEYLQEKSIVERVFDEADVLIFSDDTQMTLFTAEGILRAYRRGTDRGICHIPSVVFNSYLRWLHTQGSGTCNKQWTSSMLNGWLIENRELYYRRAPGMTCMSALYEGVMGKIDKPINDSKGCGAVMRMAPVGLFFNEKRAYSIGKEIGAITHTHPSGYISAGAFALLIAGIINGKDLYGSIEQVKYKLEKEIDGEECLSKINLALSLLNNGLPHVDNIEKIGGGWTGEDALAIAIYSALSSKQDFEAAIAISVLHGGDSDSTGSITGNIMGALLGVECIKTDWIEKLEISNVIKEMSNDLFIKYRNDNEWSKRYPGM